MNAIAWTAKALINARKVASRDYVVRDGDGDIRAAIGADIESIGYCTAQSLAERLQVHPQISGRLLNSIAPRMGLRVSRRLWGGKRRNHWIRA